MLFLSRIHLNMSLEDKLVKKSILYTGKEEDMISYLEELWSSDEEYKCKKKNFSKLPKNIPTKRFQTSLKNMTEYLVFRGNFGAYNDKLEKEMSLNKKSIILSEDNCKLLYNCFNDLFRFNMIRESLFRKIRNADIFIKYKKDDTNVPSNFRFLSNHHKLFKIIDKFWTNNLISVLKKNNKLPDKDIVRNNFDREYLVAIKDLAIEKLKVYKSKKHILMIDLKKAFDNVSWNTLENLLISNLTRKINKNTAKKYVEQYMFLNSQRNICYNSNSIKIKKSIGTGLPSSTIVFSLLIEEVIYQWYNKENCKDEVKVNTYVDDMFLEFKSLERVEYLINSLFNMLTEYKFIVNKSKTLTNINGLGFPLIEENDCYLGLPFASNKDTYISNCIDLFKNRYYDITKKEIVDILKSENYPKVKKEILGFFNYKLHGLKLLDYEKIDVLEILDE